MPPPDICLSGGFSLGKRQQKILLIIINRLLKKLTITKLRDKISAYKMKTNVRGKSVMRVLLVEDDYAISQSIETMLKKKG